MGLNWTFIGLSITSSWGNGHATTFRALLKSLHRAGHQVTFLERNEEWYASNRDLARPSFCRTILYDDLKKLRRRHAATVADADVVIIGSYVRDGVDVIDWARRTATGVFGFYDIDTPVTLAKLARHDYEYLHPRQIPTFDLYCSFSGGYALEVLAKRYGAARPRALYCSVDPNLYFPEPAAARWDLGYLGTYSDDRQPTVNELLIKPARTSPDSCFVVAGPQYPSCIQCPGNVKRINHLPPGEHRAFYNAQRFTLNVTRADMRRMGHSPSVRLFEAAACGVPVISDKWTGLDDIFAPGEILTVASAAEVERILTEMTESERREIGRKARARVMSEHTADHRAAELVSYVEEIITPACQTRTPAKAAYALHPLSRTTATTRS
jgi:spore maturation protein CgeB